jgi:Zn finger protein HypA/HybF involved in hydrogenase expression
MANIEFNKELKVENGELQVMCPECQTEFKAPVKNMKDPAMNLKEPIDCPGCQKELTKVLPDRETYEEMMEQVRKRFEDDFLSSYV